MFVPAMRKNHSTKALGTNRQGGKNWDFGKGCAGFALRSRQSQVATRWIDHGVKAKHINTNLALWLSSSAWLQVL